MDKELETRVYYAIEKWTVFRLIELHIAPIALESLKQDLLSSLKASSVCLLKNKAVATQGLSCSISRFLERLDVEIDQDSCDRMASILCDIYLELRVGGCEVYRKITGARKEEYTYESSE